MYCSYKPCMPTCKHAWLKLTRWHSSLSSAEHCGSIIFLTHSTDSLQTYAPSTAILPPT